ncbi:MAG: ABC transporter ATP-binding protein [Gemmatimonadota bacterium]
MTGLDAAVRLAGVSRRFGALATSSVQAVNDVSLAVRRGALTLVMGPSGSGKTTLLSMIGGLLAPTEGTVEVEGIDLASLTPAALADFRLRSIGFVFQRFRLLDALSALENIELPLTLAGARRPASRVRAVEVAARVGLTSRLDSKSEALSGGEQQRVAIARALANAPSLLLADEPTGSLDSRAGHRIIELLHAVAAVGTTVLVVSHDERLIPFADTVVRMEDGRISAIE